MELVGFYNISYKEKKVLVTMVCQMYKRLNAIKEFVKGKNDFDEQGLNDRIVELGKEHFKSSSLFETMIGLLRADHALIIKNEFIETMESEWYEQHWSRTTYFNLKKAAIDAFLFLLYV